MDYFCNQEKKKPFKQHFIGKTERSRQRISPNQGFSLPSFSGDIGEGLLIAVMPDCVAGWLSEGLQYHLSAKHPISHF